ncbi:MAG: hydroxymethylpyrimidine/phosphomethylpyrimidine kinase [Gammaproteobacteria bacterium]|nr:hydroxymethylpyrimidine/phosphomethylpyrimidine kinase [Gammaproteobacteria bacterium]
MKLSNQSPPTVICFSGLDPTGGAGLQADIEAIASMGCHAAPLATAITVQDTHGVMECTPVDADILTRQAQLIFSDIPIAACKIGLVAGIETVHAIHDFLADHADLPIVLDPVLASGRGDPLTTGTIREQLRSLLLPLATIVTPNSLEAMALVPQARDLDGAAKGLMESGSEYVLITGTHESTDQVTNTLYGHQRRLDSSHWDRLPHSYHGSGCTLASAIAGLLAGGREPVSAVRQAQEYTWQTLAHSYRIGSGQPIPNRHYSS